MWETCGGSSDASATPLGIVDRIELGSRWSELPFGSSVSGGSSCSAPLGRLWDAPVTPWSLGLAIDMHVGWPFPWDASALPGRHVGCCLGCVWRASWFAQDASAIPCGGCAMFTRVWQPSVETLLRRFPSLRDASAIRSSGGA